MTTWLGELVLPLLNAKDRIAISAISPDLYEEERRTRRTLDLSQATDDQIPPLLSRYPHLRGLTMRRIDAKNVDALVECCKSVVFLYARIRLSVLRPLRALGRLKYLYLYKSQARGNDFSDLGQHLPLLRTLKLEECSRVEHSDLTRFLSESHNLKHLAVQNCTLLYDGDKWIDCHAIKKLSSLRLDSVRFTTSLVYDSPPEIQIMAVDCSTLSSETFEEISLGFPGIRDLEIIREYSVDRECILTLVGNLKNLRILRVSSVLSLFNLTEDASLNDDIVGALTDLQRLEINSVTSWTAGDLMPVRKLKNLHTLVLKIGDPAITDLDISDIAKSARYVPCLVLHDVPRAAVPRCNAMSRTRAKRQKTTRIHVSAF